MSSVRAMLSNWNFNIIRTLPCISKFPALDLRIHIVLRYSSLGHVPFGAPWMALLPALHLANELCYHHIVHGHILGVIARARANVPCRNLVGHVEGYGWPSCSAPNWYCGSSWACHLGLAWPDIGVVPYASFLTYLAMAFGVISRSCSWLH
jgi:hypothetical protein